MDSHELPLPTFLIIGAQKSATRWLRLNLGLHPDIFSARRELEFFNNGDRVERAGLVSYRAQFEGWSGEPFVGEATPGYMFWHHGAAVVVGTHPRGGPARSAHRDPPQPRRPGAVGGRAPHQGWIVARGRGRHGRGAADAS